ncbi:MAG: hypothetical protein NTY02_13230 [Acidobacteria bacterium]|nr:hypothetical protein [Acidobacteriota bacterium]
MKHIITTALVALVAAETLAAGQGKDPGQVLADAQAALGGDKLATVKTLAGSGRILRTGPGGNTVENEFEVSMDLPDKYLMHSVLASMGNMSIYRNSGFNGGQVIEEIDRPPNLAGGNIVIRIAGPGGASTDPEKMTPEQKAEADRLRLLSNRKDFARLTLGMFASSPAAYPLEFTYGGQAESPDGKADVIDVKGEGDFAAKLFIDAQTHMPLMLSWMAKEPLVIQMGGPGGAPGGPGGANVVAGGGGGTQVVQRVERSGSGGPPSPEELDKMRQDVEARRKEAEAKLRVVEFRVYYSDYQTVSGVKLPFKIQRSIDGKPTEEMVFDEFKVNPKIDAKKFQVAK